MHTKSAFKIAKKGNVLKKLFLFCMYFILLHTSLFADIENCAKFKEFFNDKSVAIIGNAQSLFDYELGDEIDSHDIVIRMNSGMIQKSISQGSKTTIWASSFPLKENVVNNEFNPKYIFWITPKLSVKPLYSISFHKKMFMLPFNVWEELFKNLDETRPTTGLSIIYFLLEHCLTHFLSFCYYQDLNV